MSDLFDIGTRLGSGVWTMACLGHPTDFGLSSSGLIHGMWCHHEADQLDLPHLVDALVGGAAIAQCCHPTPLHWIKTHKDALTVAEKLLDGVAE